MKTIRIILLILIIIGLGLIFTQKYWVEGLVDFILQNTESKEVAKNDVRNFTFTLRDKIYTFDNGVAMDGIKIFGEPVIGDLNGDGQDDAVMFVTEESGGSGTFFYIVEAISYGGAYKGTNAMFLGDRIAPQNINIVEGRAVANFAERRADEPMTTPPSVGKSVWVHFDPASGEIGEWVKDFEDKKVPL